MASDVEMKNAILISLENDKPNKIEDISSEGTNILADKVRLLLSTMEEEGLVSYVDPSGSVMPQESLDDRRQSTSDFVKLTQQGEFAKKFGYKYWSDLPPDSVQILARQMSSFVDRFEKNEQSEWWLKRLTGLSLFITAIATCFLAYFALR